MSNLLIDYDVHLHSGRVWRVDVELPREDTDDCLSVSVDVVAPSRDLATYIAATMYPTYESLSVPDEPLH